MTWNATILTLFPEMFPGPLGHSLAGKAKDKDIWSLATVDIRDFATDRHGTVDDTPFGGGAGMVMRPDIVDAAIRSVAAPGRLLVMSPKGRVFDQALAVELAASEGVTILCGRYEGIDQRVIDAHQGLEVSVGDYVLSGGEVAAMTILDACVRLLPGVLGNAATSDEESFVGGLLEYPHYTRPAAWTDANGVERRVPEMLLSGHHEKIRVWRREQSERVTQARRPDLWQKSIRNRRIQMIPKAVITELVGRNDPATSRVDGSYKKGINGHGTFDSFKISKEDLDRWSSASSLSKCEFCNSLGLFIAIGFQSGKLPFYFCDSVVNELWNHVSPTSCQPPDAPEIFWDIYWAFDAGEYYHDGNRSEDPIKVYTRPVIATLLAKYGVPLDIQTLIDDLQVMTRERQITPIEVIPLKG